MRVNSLGLTVAGFDTTPAGMYCFGVAALAAARHDKTTA